MNLFVCLFVPSFVFVFWNFCLTHYLLLVSIVSYSAYDSGSPIIIPGDGADVADVIVGLVSWGEGCADPDFPGAAQVIVYCISFSFQ